MAVIVLLSKVIRAGKSPSVSETSEAAPKAEINTGSAHIDPQPTSSAQNMEAPAAPQILAPGSAGPLVLRDVDEKDAALLMAIVAYRMKKPLCQLRFISIKQVYETGGSK